MPRRPALFAFATLALLTAGVACRSDRTDLRVDVVVPADAPAMHAGVLRLSLWAYDPTVADAPATLVDADSRPIVRQRGEEQHFRMRVRGEGPPGSRHYLTVRGVDRTSAGEIDVLWDGIEGTALPTRVVMRTVTPAP